MARKATDQVTTISIDIGKNTVHLIGLDGRFGSKADLEEARSITYQAVLYGCTTFVAVRPLHRERSNSDTRTPRSGAP